MSLLRRTTSSSVEYFLSELIAFGGIGKKIIDVFKSGPDVFSKWLIDENTSDKDFTDISNFFMDNIEVGELKIKGSVTDGGILHVSSVTAKGYLLIDLGEKGTDETVVVCIVEQTSPSIGAGVAVCINNTIDSKLTFSWTKNIKKDKVGKVVSIPVGFSKSGGKLMVIICKLSEEQIGDISLTIYPDPYSGVEQVGIHHIGVYTHKAL